MNYFVNVLTGKFKDTKGQSETVIRRTNNTMTKNGQNTFLFSTN